MILWVVVWIVGGFAAISVLALIGVIAWDLAHGLGQLMRPGVLRMLERVYVRLDYKPEMEERAVLDSVPMWAIELVDEIWCLPETQGFPVATDD